MVLDEISKGVGEGGVKELLYAGDLLLPEMTAVKKIQKFERAKVAVVWAHRRDG